MPNHVINEVIFRGLNDARRAEILANIGSAEQAIDFGGLLPMPLNVWDASCSRLHEETFKITGLDWATKNWGTKWNAYGLDEGGKYRSVVDEGGTLTLTFQTAWRPPYGWLIALLNRFKTSFDHNWLDEGRERAVVGRFDAVAYQNDVAGTPWAEKPASDEIHRHLHKLMWGVEEFPPEDDDNFEPPTVGNRVI